MDSPPGLTSRLLPSGSHGGTDQVLFSLAAFLCGLLVLERGADRFVDSSAVLAKRLGISPTLVGLLTCGAEWEELVVVVAAMSQRQGALALGNLMGSSVANILGSFSLGLLFCSTEQGGVMRFDQSSRIYTVILMALTAVFLIMLYTGKKQAGGIALVVAFVVYIVSVVSMIYKGSMTAPETVSDSSSDPGSESDAYSAIDSASDSESEAEIGGSADDSRARLSTDAMERGLGSMDDQNHAQNSSTRRRQSRNSTRGWSKHASRIIVGLVMMAGSGYVLAQSASVIGASMGLSSTVTGTTILSVATTLPEKMVAVMAGSRRQPGILVANTVGSNIFLITLCGGVLLLGTGDSLQNAFSFSEALAMGASALALLFVVLVGGRRWMGVLLLLGYLLFLGVEFVHGANDKP